MDMRIVGNQNRNEIELNPEAAYRRGLQLDAMLRAARAPVPRGVLRGTHAFFQSLDQARMIEIARRINQTNSAPQEP